MSQINFCGIPNAVKTSVPEIKEIAMESKNIKPFPEMCKKEVKSTEIPYFSPYTINDIPVIADTNKKLSAQLAEDAYKKSPIPYN